MTDIAFPYSIGPDGRTARATPEDHVRDLVAQVLFTAPGERVNRPTFGTPLPRLVFEPASSATAAAVRQSVQGALQQWLAALVLVEGVDVEVAESTLRVHVRYVVRETAERRIAEFTRGTQ